MNVLDYSPTLPHALDLARNPRSLIREQDVIEYIGNDPATHRRVYEMCLALLTRSLPKFHEALEIDDVMTARRFAHMIRGSLGMLGLPALQELSEDIEYQYEILGPRNWRQRCEGLYGLLKHLQQELQQRLAA